MVSDSKSIEPGNEGAPEEVVRRYVRVVPVAGGGRIGKSLTYRIPTDLLPAVKVGTVVAVTVRNSKRIGVVTSFHEKDEVPEASPYVIKPVDAVYSEEDLLRGSDIDIARWLAGYYACSLRDALAPFTPEVRALQAVTTLYSDDREKFSEALNSLGLLFSRPEAVPIEYGEDGTARVSREDLVDVIRMSGTSESGAKEIIKDWLNEEILQPRVSIRTKVRQLGRATWLSLTPDSREMDWSSIRSDKQKRVLEMLDRFGGTISREEITREIPGSQSAVRQLVKKGLATEIVDSSLVPHDRPLESTLRLSRAQDDAVKSISSVMNRGVSRTFLIFGVTGSGKTEIYIELSRQALANGKRVTILVPEIALTYQTVQRFMRAFPGRIALMHSELTERERLHEWRLVRRGERDIVIGARSALFAPIPDRGLIVIDEESETAYKQHQRPKYHVREVARRMSKMEGSVLVLGSATPSVESYHAALKGTYQLVKLPDRVVGGRLPEVQCIRPEEAIFSHKEDDEKIEVEGKKLSIGLLSQTLREELSLTLQMKRQALLFLNLRGFAQSLICSKCGWVPMCENCDVSLTYHRRERIQLCHHCGHREHAVNVCDRCGNENLGFLGWGTERLEAEVHTLFPRARTLRMDRDSVGTRGRRRSIVEAMRKHEVDILLGTQMIAKGLDFPSVRLVGVISADQSLHVPDFRASERTFQLLTQVIGRSGRSEKLEREGGGVAVIQSFDPDNRVLKTACMQDYESFYAHEIKLRERFGYPPATHLARIILSSAEKSTAADAVFNLGRVLEKMQHGKDQAVLGPAPAPFEKLEGRWRFHVILKAPRVSILSSWIRSAIAVTRNPKGVKMDIDIDPMSML